MKDPEKRAKHNTQQLQAMIERLKDPEKRAKHNTQQLQAKTERLNDHEQRAKHNMQERQRLKDPSSREKHNSCVLKKYITDRASVEPTSLDYFFQISQGPTFVCSCCGCLHFRRSVVILTRARLDSMSEYSPTFINQVCSPGLPTCRGSGDSHSHPMGMGMGMKFSPVVIPIEIPMGIPVTDFIGFTFTTQSDDPS